MIASGSLGAFAQVTAIDVLLAGDNAIAVGALAASLTQPMRSRALLLGVTLALAFRIAFALGVAYLFALPGIQFVGGLLLLLIAAKMGWEIVKGGNEDDAPAARGGFWKVALAITIADISLSLDNVLGVAGAAAHHPEALAFGLVLSVAVMGLAATMIAALIRRYPAIAWVGVALIALVAARMLIEGAPGLERLFG